MGSIISVSHPFNLVLYDLCSFDSLKNTTFSLWLQTIQKCLKVKFCQNWILVWNFKVWKLISAQVKEIRFFIRILKGLSKGCRDDGILELENVVALQLFMGGKDNRAQDSKNWLLTCRSKRQEGISVNYWSEEKYVWTFRFLRRLLPHCHIYTKFRPSF